MIQKTLLVLSVLSSTLLLGQQAISGYVHRENDGLWEQEVQLRKIALRDIPDLTKTTLVATVEIASNGFFAFERKFIADKNTIYQLHVDRIQKILNDSEENSAPFIISSRDTIHFKKGKRLFGTYTNSNKADIEWKRLQNFEKNLYKNPLHTDSIAGAYVFGVKKYTKDSLQILMVKLIGIKQLENKKLLDTDIAKNPEYYITFLAELKASDLNRSQYLFLENKLAFMTTDVAERKYGTSRLLNIILGVIILSLIILLVYKRKRNTPEVIDLSRQERTIQNLILAGKSNKEIANELFISISTVKTHITNLYSKLNVGNRQELFQKTQD